MVLRALMEQTTFEAVYAARLDWKGIKEEQALEEGSSTGTR